MLAYTCPKCGKYLQFSTIVAYPPIHIAECSSCGWREEKRDMIVGVPYKTSDVVSQPSCGLLDKATYYKITENGQLCIVKDVYTKADVITILTELQQEIKNTVEEEELIDEKWAKGLHYSEKIIQQKINELKGNAD